MDVLDKADITCDQTLVETDKVIKVSDFLGKYKEILLCII